MIVTTARTWDNHKLYLDHKNRVTTDAPKTLVTVQNRREFEKLAFLTLEQITRRTK